MPAETLSGFVVPRQRKLALICAREQAMQLCGEFVLYRKIHITVSGRKELQLDVDR
jgi:hypothetical protein